MKIKKASLLQDLQIIVGCTFLSDLRNITFHKNEKIEISQISEELYSLEEWNKAAFYISGTVCDFLSIQAVKEFLITNQ